MPITLAIRAANPSGCQVSFNTLRGFYYNLQSAPDPSQPFTNDPAGLVQAVDSSMVRLDNGAAACKLLRVVRRLGP
jgi:hypothetical protein